MPASTGKNPLEFRQFVPWYYFIKWFMRGLLGTAFGVRAIGKENVPLTGPVILAPVHFSHLDPPLVGCVSPRVLRTMAKEELFKGIFGRLIYSFGTFPVKRGSGDSGSMRVARKTLEDGGALLIFPEGTRGDGETMLPIQSGFAMLAEMTQAQVVPVGIAGTSIAMPRDEKGFHRHRLTVCFGKPFTYAELGLTGKEGRAQFQAIAAQKIAEACLAAGQKVKTFPATTPTSPGETQP